MAMKPRDPRVEAVVEAMAEAFYNRIFEERWADLAPNSIERALYFDAACDAFCAAAELMAIKVQP